MHPNWRNEMLRVDRDTAHIEGGNGTLCGKGDAYPQVSGTKVVRDSTITLCKNCESIYEG